MLLCMLVAQGIGLALGALIVDLKSSTTLGSVLMLSFTLASGYCVQHVPAFIAWIRYISLSFYSLQTLLMASQFSPTDTYHCTHTIDCKIAGLPSVARLASTITPEQFSSCLLCSSSIESSLTWP